MPVLRAGPRRFAAARARSRLFLFVVARGGLAGHRALAAADRLEAAVVRAPVVDRVAIDHPAPHRRDDLGGAVAGRVECLGEGVLLEEVGAHEIRGVEQLAALPLVEQAPRFWLRGRGERNVDAADRVDAPQLAQGEHVELRLQLALLREPRGSGHLGARLVVADQPGPAAGRDVYAVDLAVQAQPAEIERRAVVVRAVPEAGL